MRLTVSLEKTRQKFLGQLGDLFKNSELDDIFWEDLEDLLISADAGLETSESIVHGLKERMKSQKLNSGQDCLKELKVELVNILTFDKHDLPDYL